MRYKKYSRKFRHMLSAPFIWMVFMPIAALDIVMEIYHRLCFPLYGLEYIDRKKYVKLDRYKLEYLEWYDKLNCLYCEYANGVLPYATAIAAKTEEYWCGIKHKEDYAGYIVPKHHKNFIEHGDKKTYMDYCKLKK